MKKLTKEQIEQRHFWADHLDGEHGIEWLQAKNFLCSDEGFCCLGVAAALGLTEPKPASADSDYPYSIVHDFAGYNGRAIKDFVVLNDYYDATFEEIADVIRLSCEYPNIDIISLYFSSTRGL